MASIGCQIRLSMIAESRNELIASMSTRSRLLGRWLDNSWATLRHSIYDGDFRQIYQGAGYLIFGNGFKFLLTIAAYSLTARALGVSQFGVFALIQGYVLLMDRLLNFNTRQAVVKYGAQEAISGNRSEFQRLMKFLLLLDIGASLVATVLAIGAGYFLAEQLGWSQQLVPAAILYCTIILFNSTAPAGVLRLFNRFGALTLGAMAASTVKLAGVFVAYQLEAQPWTFILAWAVGDIVERVLLVLLGFREMRRREFYPFSGQKLRGVTYRHEGIRTFLLSANLESAVRLLSYEVDIFIVAYFLDLYAVGVYKIIKEVVLVVVGVGDTINQSSYPLLARLWVSQEYEKIRRYLRDMRLIGSVCSVAILVLCFLFARSIFAAIFAVRDDIFFIPFLIAMCGPLLWMSQSAYASAMYTLGFAMELLMISVGAAVISILCHLIFTPRYGLEGAAMSLFSSFVVWSISTYVFVNKGLRPRLLQTAERPISV